MKELRKLLPIILAAVTGIIALIMGNNPFETINSLPTPTTPTISTEDNFTPSPLVNLPTQVKGDQLIQHQYYTLSYSSRHQNPEWVAYELYATRLNTPHRQERCNFQDDPKANDANSAVYNRSGYDRGHLAPAHDMSFNATAMQESFYMSNIAPQVPDFNRGIWKSLEHRVRTWAKNAGRLYVVTGPLLRQRISEDQRLKTDGPTIPRGFFKIIVDNRGREKKGIAFMFKNKATDQPLENFVTSIDRVESYTNIDFFPNLSDEEEKQIEARADITHW